MSDTAPKPNEKDTAKLGSEGEESIGRFSLHRLSAAFARLTGNSDASSPPEIADTLGELSEQSPPERQFGSVVSPRMIVEGLLFVGHADGQPLSSRELAAPIRDVSPVEVEVLIEELNECYKRRGTCYHIVSDGAGFQMQLRPELEHFRQRFGGREKQARLTPQTIEVLSVVAYKQPITVEEVTRLRGCRSSGQLNQLVRRGLLRLERPSESSRRPLYRTTDRFKRLFHLASLRDLPKSEDLDDS